LLIAARKMPRTRALVNGGKNPYTYQCLNGNLTAYPLLRLLNGAGLPRCGVMSYPYRIIAPFGAGAFGEALYIAAGEQLSVRS
jgi:hypothetical protein